MTEFAQLLFQGISLGATYALVALGFVVVYRASGVINFAQGELLLVGVYIVSAGVFEYHLNFFVALVIALVLTALIGVLFERFVLRRMIGRPIFSILMITIGLDILLRTLITIRIGAQYEVPAATPFDIYSGIDIGGSSS